MMARATALLTVATVLLLTSCGDGSQATSTSAAGQYATVEELADALGADCAGNLDLVSAEAPVVEQGSCEVGGTLVTIAFYEDTAALNAVLAKREELQRAFDESRAKDPQAELNRLFFIYRGKWAVYFSDDSELVEELSEELDAEVNEVS